MLEIFNLYFGIGRAHILDYANGYDHILFVVALCVGHTMYEWRKILVLITAFTIGHTITLALATLHILHFEREEVEFFITITIFITAFFNLFQKQTIRGSIFLAMSYFLALFFGLIHGMGFSTYLQALLGQSASILMPLLAFNLGLEFGQAIIIFIFAVVSYLLVDIAGISRTTWRMVISSGIAGAALVLAKGHVFW